MSRQPKKTIGLILPSIVASFRDSLIDGLSNQFQDKGYKLLLALANHNLDCEKEYLTYFSSVTDCIILISEAERYSQIADAISGEVPILFLFNKPADCPYTCVLESDYTAIYQAIIACTNQNVTRIGCVCANRKLSSTKEFLRAYYDAMNATSARYNEDLIVDVAGSSEFSAKEVVLDMAYKGCRAILAATPAITNRLLDYLIFYNTNPLNEPIALFGYGILGSTLSSQMNIDVILHPTGQIADLTVQQTIYLINHPDFNHDREFLIKGALRMHTYDGLNTHRD